MKKNRHDNMDYAKLLKEKEERLKRLQNSKNPFLLSVNQTDAQLYNTLYKFNTEEELSEFSLPFSSRSEVPQKKKKMTIKPEMKQIPEIEKSQREDEIEEKQQEQKYYDTITSVFNEKNKKPVNQIQNALFIDNVVNEQLKLINTGEDAISFFAKYGNSTPVKFIYCMRDKSHPSYVYRPYDLRVIKEGKNSKEHTLDEYYTISALGIVHVYTEKGKKTSQVDSSTSVVSLSEWMHDSTLFNIITNIHFFKLYANKKIFNTWKANTRYRQYSKTRKLLVKNCFYSKPAFGNHLLEINKIIFDLQQKKCISDRFLFENKTWDLDDFKTEQKKARQDAQQSYNLNIDKLIRVFIYKQQQIETVKKEVEDRTQLKEQDENEDAKFGKQVKAKPMNLIRRLKEEHIYFLELAQADKEKLRKFIRMIDYWTIQTLIKVSFQSMILLYEEMQKNDRKTGALFNCNVRYEQAKDGQQQGMIFEPTQQLIQEACTGVQGVLVEMSKLALSTTRVLNYHGFENIVKTITNIQIDKLIENSNQYKGLKENIELKVENDFGQAQAYVDVNYEKCRMIEDDCILWSIDAIKDQFLAKQHTLEYTKNELLTLRQWEGLINSNIKEQDKGIIKLDGKRIKQKLTQHVTFKIDHFKDYLYKLMKEKSQNSYNTLNFYLECLSKQPQTLTEYAKYIEYTKEAEKILPQLENDKVEIESMNSLIKKFDPQMVKQTDNTQLNDIQQGFTELNQKKLDSQEFINQKKTENQEKLEKAMTDLQKDIQQTDQLINSGFLILDNIPGEIPSITMAMKDITQVKQALNDISKSIQKQKDKEKNLSSYQTLMLLPQKKNVELQEMEQKFNDRKLLWTNIEKFAKKSQDWLNNQFMGLEVEEIEKDMKFFEQSNIQLKMRVSNLSDTGSDKVLEFFIIETKNMNVQMPIISALGNKDLRGRHWKQIFEALNPNWNPGKVFTFAELVERGVLDKKDLVEDISGRATGEAQIEAQLDQIKKKWAELAFVVLPYRESKDKFRITGIDDIITALDDHQVSIQTMLGTRFVQEIRPQVEEWEKKLVLISDIIDEWLTCQRNWMYLENIFNAPDIQKQLPLETAKFMVVDKFFRDIMVKTNKHPIVINCCNSEELLLKFQANNKNLDDIQKCLENYLETKKLAFPRFYFLSNDELLEILSQTRNPHAVQPHLRKCFDNINRIKFTEDENSREVIAMVSAEPENMPEQVMFQQSVIIEPEDKVENWLMKIQVQMIDSLRAISVQSYFDFPFKEVESRQNWIFGPYPAQGVLLVEMIRWQEIVTEAIYKAADDKNSLQECFNFWQKIMFNMVDIVCLDLDLLQRTLMCALMTLDVHARDVIEMMKNENVNTIENFNWSKQLRYYFEEEIQDNVVRQTNTRFVYSYEYLGNGPRLVITPLTDNCYMTLTGALHLNYGGAPAGPAGTGKTETTKDLAKALAVQCVVFNCSDSLDYRTMGRFFSGLSQCGAWACFDEFNRIDIEVLSVIAQQILTIQTNVRAKNEKFEFDGQIIPLNLRFGVFITMNPGYAGRTELPDNLKSLFRPIAMMIPNYALIAEIMFLGDGFQSARQLGQKMVQLYQLSSEQLSKQKHYDFGMRAVKSVLVMAGNLRRENPQLNEEMVLIRAMRDSNIPKFLDQDLPLFFGIISDLFPGVKVPKNEYPDLERAILNNLTLDHLQKPPSFIVKIIQLMETIMVRHGVMLVGATGTGKTKVYEILRKSLIQLHKEGIVNYQYKPVQLFKLNPKSVTMNDLYGYVNVLTNEWSDGIVAKIVRDAVAEVTQNKRWLMFDGPVDAIWIENLNTVLDDNKMLCLSNGQRIKLPQTFIMMFEVQDLAVASPATVSRCGMVYIDNNQLGWEPIVETWGYFFKEKTLEIPEEQIPTSTNPVCVQVTNLVTKFKDLFNEQYSFLRKECKEMIATSDVNLVQSCLNMVECMYYQLANHLGGKEKIEKLEKADLDLYFNLMLIFCFIWTIGGNVHDGSSGGNQTYRNKYSQFIKSKILKIYTSFPFEGDIYDYFINWEKKEFQSWNDVIPEFVFNPNTPFFNILVPTADTVKFGFLVDKLISGGFNVLLMGETGVGKSIVVSEYLMKINVEKFVYSNLNFSAQTSSQNVQDLFMDKDKFVKKKKDLLGPPAGKQMVIFVDDINMPLLETYGAQPPIELLRQIIDHGGFYDLKKLQFMYVKDCIFTAACAPPSGGRNPVTPRLFRHFNMIWVPDLNQRSMETIFNSILKGFLLPTKNLDKLSQNIVKSTIDIYFKTQKDLLPTPSKCHYTFNLRDVAKVFQGVLQIKYDYLVNKEYLVSLWIHEMNRVFYDRLVDDKDKDFFLGQIQDKIKSNLDLEWTFETIKDLLFGDFSNKQKDYIKIDNPHDLNKTLQDQLQYYNLQYPKTMNLVFFTDAIYHCTKICRILKTPRGNALLIGVGGSGRGSLTRLAGHIRGQQTFTIEITKSYKEVAWKDDLRKLLKQAGSKDTPTLFLFSDTQIVKESFLEDINNVLNTGEVPNLMALEDMEEILGDMRVIVKERGLFESRDVMLKLFTQLVRENLHIVLTFSPVGEKLRNRCRQFPSLINCCTIDWYTKWPDEALYSVALKEYAANEHLGIGDYKESLAELSVSLHSDVYQFSDQFYNELRRRNYTTPTSYLELIKLYIQMLKIQQNILPLKIRKYKVGLQTLSETNIEVNKLKQQIIEFQPILEQSSKDNAALLIELEEKSAIAEKTEAIVSKEASEAQVQRDEVNELKTNCQRDLDEAMPILESAKKAVANIDKSQLNIIKSFTSPPPLVVTVLQSCCLLFGHKETWEDAKKQLLGNMKFLEQLIDFDVTKTPEKRFVQLRNSYLKDPNFNKENVLKVSEAAASIYTWVIAIDSFQKVKKVVGPKEAALAEALVTLQKVESVLASKMSGLHEVQEMVANLNRRLQESEKKAEVLKNQMDQAQKQLARAEKLVGGLSSESQRWLVSADKLEEDLKNLTGNIMLSAAFVAYLGPFTAGYRQVLIEKWIRQFIDKKIPTSKDYAIDRILSDENQIREWQDYDLPADKLSTENAILIYNTRRWPLIIDPQNQANSWIRKLQGGNNLQIGKLSEANFAKILENCIRFGQPFLLENVEEELDPMLEPVLLKQTFKKGPQVLLKLGDQDIPFHNDFRLYITTKLPNPHYLPELSIKVTIINFTVTMVGLEDQLLAEVVRYERLDLEEKRIALMMQISQDKRQLQELEDKILKLISEVQGRILEDEELILTLDASKVTSDTVNKRMKQSKITQEEIRSTRESYRVVAKRGSVLYFAIADLALIDPMYQYSLEFFIKLFKRRMEKSEVSDVLDTRLKILIDDITINFYKNICRGLFEKDKLLYSFLITVKIQLNEHLIQSKDWNFFLRGATTDPDEIDLVQPEYLSAQQWKNILSLQQSDEVYNGLAQSFIDSHHIYNDILESELPFEIVLPEVLSGLSSFQRLLVIKLLRDEKLLQGIKIYIDGILGRQFIESPMFDLKAAFDDSYSTTPIIFILSPGADPMSYLFELAKNMNMFDKLKILSLGQGQGEKAKENILSGRRNGDWICLQNCHLAVSWLQTLERIQEQQVESEINPQFRLWLTSMPSNKFPVPVLQNGIKLTNEPPKGLKANLSRTYNEIKEEIYMSSAKPREFQKLLFSLAFFHAIILERRKFGAIGWNIPHDWMNSDFETSQIQLKMHVDEQPQIPYEALNVIIAEINYGGRVTDDKDMRLIKALLLSYINPQLMEGDYNFSRSGVYRSPTNLKLSDVQQQIANLPLEDDPEVFGLNFNANITCQQKIVRDFMETLQSVSPRTVTSGGGGESPDEIALKLAISIEQQISAPIQYRQSDKPNSLEIFRNQEIDRFNILIRALQRSLVEIQKAIKGLVVMSQELELMYNSFLSNKVPDNWSKVGYLSLKPLASWIKDFIEKVDFFKQWVIKGTMESYFIPAMFFPQGFNTAVKQVYSREKQIPIDTLIFSTRVERYDYQPVELDIGVNIHGLYLQGCRFDDNTMQLEESHKKQLFTLLPTLAYYKFILSLIPVTRQDYNPGNSYQCPLYKTTLRRGELSTTGHSTNFVLYLDVNTGVAPEHWIRRGVALICQLDD